MSIYNDQLGMFPLRGYYICQSHLLALKELFCKDTKSVTPPLLHVFREENEQSETSAKPTTLSIFTHTLLEE